MREGTSIYRSREETWEKEEVKNLLNKPWFKQMRGGTKIREEKEGKVRRQGRGGKVREKAGASEGEMDAEKLRRHWHKI